MCIACIIVDTNVFILCSSFVDTHVDDLFYCWYTWICALLLWILMCTPQPLRNFNSYCRFYYGYSRKGKVSTSMGTH